MTGDNWVAPQAKTFARSVNFSRLGQSAKQQLTFAQKAHVFHLHFALQLWHNPAGNHEAYENS
eukprot:4212017-Pyramimonas_sp.AAC.1